MANPVKKIIKSLIGRDGYSILINSKIGSKMHDRLHSESVSSRDFLLQLLPKHSVGVEIGVNDGNFSERILEIVRPKKLHLIDPWAFISDTEYAASPYGRDNVKNQETMDNKYNSVKKKFMTLIKKDQITIHRGLSETLFSVFDDSYFDWVYIDGNHLYDFVKKDLNLYYSKVKSGGFITGDDYYDGGWSSGGVKKAVDEFVNTGMVKLILIKNNQFILQKIS